jgi:alginate O-acetyltransferase complex protein AlgI
VLFNSLHFCVFFLLTSSLYFAMKGASRLTLLLISSCYFYAAFVPQYLLILFFVILVDYTSGRLLAHLQVPAHRKAVLLASVMCNVGLLCVFKYFNFFMESVEWAGLGLTGREFHLPLLKLVLPIGLSFHTFQSLSYVIEVYRNNFPAEKRLDLFALYVLFYPQLVAGPIERPQNVLTQFHEEPKLSAENFVCGLERALWGMIKKVVIADRLSTYVDAVYNNVAHHNGWTFWFATFLFALQIYADFSGYCDIALGVARCLGYRLMENFRRPYMACSIQEFWQRWHISLSTWFRDYLYIPLGGSRTSAVKAARNLMVVFLVSGLWHGANWTYVIWGFLHGAYLILYLYISKPILSFNKNQAGRRLLGGVVTSLCVLTTWVFFRVHSVADGFRVLAAMFHPVGGLYTPDIGLLASCVVWATVLLGVDAVEEFRSGFWAGVFRYSAIRRVVAFSLGVLLITLFGVFDGGQFIYFQF